MNHLDVGEFKQLMEESADLQVDAMRGMKEPLDEIVEVGRERRAGRDYLEARREGALALGLGALGAVGLVSAAGAPAFAADDMDVMALQTAASLENLAVFTYKTALTLPYLKSDARPIKTVRAFAMMTMAQHAEHARAFNARVTELGGKEQHKTNPKYTPVVAGMVPKLKKGGPLDVVKLAITLEDIATSTYVKNIEDIGDPKSRLLFGTIAGVESQHLATLYAVKALLEAKDPSAITLKATGGPTDATRLPAAAGSVGAPEAFKKTDLASPPSEGAVR